MHRVFKTLIGAACCCAAGAVAAQPGYPDKPVKWVVPFSPGGSADAVPRLVAQRLGSSYTVVIDNRTGAGGNIGADAVAKAAPDGYTLLASTPAPIVVNRYLYKEVPFGPEALVPIAIFGSAPIVLAVRADLPVNSLADFIAYARANPGKLTIANQGIGTTSHLASIQAASLAKLDVRDVPYRGSAPALTDLLAGRVDAFFDVLTSARARHESGTLKILAVSGERRAVNLPNVPTFAEQGMPGFTASTWFALLAPKGVSTEIMNRIHADVSAVVQRRDVQEELRKMDVEPARLSQAEAVNFVELERVRWKKMVEAANIKLE